jgi:hypothetical protein
VNSKSEEGLYQVARDLFDRYEEANDVWPLYRDEANARYVAEDDGDYDNYTNDAVRIFEEAKLDAFTEAVAA